MRNKIKQITPQRLWDFGRSLYFSGLYAKEWPQATFHPWRWESVKRLAKYKDRHKGDRCVIIGNGPSLNQTDVSKLKGEYTFGMNRIYLAFPDWGFETSYFVSVNDLVIEQCAADIEKLSMPKFLAWRSRGHLTSMDETMFLHTTYYNPKFSKDVRRRVWESATVTYVTLQLAYFMGFSEVILIGVDHSFSSKGEPNMTIVSAGDDPDHFNAEYFGKGFRWQLPDLDTSELGYALARRAFEADGRRVIDATIGGKLTIFPKADYSALFS
jgi:hypothetical protein